MAITISIPLLALTFVLTATFLGLANAIIKRVRDINLMMGNKGFSLGKKLDVVLNPFRLETVSVAVSFFLTRKNQVAMNGINASSHKNSGLLNSKLFQFIILSFFYY
jgi:hypothetical protein